MGVEAFPDYLEESKKKSIHSEYVQSDILKVDFPENSFDISFASEVIEHLEKADGSILLDKMEKWAIKKVIITTPNGFVDQGEYDDNSLQEHKSGWTVVDFKKRGFRVYGINGFKFLRGPLGALKYKPRIFWSVVSMLSQGITYYVPSLAFQLVAVKNINK